MVKMTFLQTAALAVIAATGAFAVPAQAQTRMSTVSKPARRLAPRAPKCVRSARPAGAIEQRWASAR